MRTDCRTGRFLLEIVWDYLPKTPALSRDTGAVEVVSVSLGRSRRACHNAPFGGRRHNALTSDEHLSFQVKPSSTVRNLQLLTYFSSPVSPKNTPLSKSTGVGQSNYLRPDHELHVRETLLTSTSFGFRRPPRLRRHIT